MRGAAFNPDDFRIPEEAKRRSTLLFEHGTLTLKLYAPRGTDDQTPHTRHEIYVVIEGSGTFVQGDERVLFKPHDLLFAPAGLAHRFEDFTEDLLVWVLFYGPEGGELQTGSTG